MRRRIIFMALLTVMVIGSIGDVLAQGTLTELVITGPRENRLNLVILAEGYTAAEESKFNTNASWAATTMLSKQPFATYVDFYNVFTIFIASNESGSDHPSSGIYRDTYFNSTYDTYGITRLISVDSQGHSRVYALLATHVPEYDLVLLLVNDTQYGGSGGSFAISSINGSAPEIVMHELGHSFANLADEYDTYTPGYTGYESYNTTAETDRNLIRWNYWILPSTPIPTPETSTYGSVVGLFEGACYEVSGWFRPELNCKMKALGYQYCDVCGERLVLSQYNRVYPIDDVWPPEPIVEVPGNVPQVFEVIPIAPTAPFWHVEWQLDGAPVAAGPDLTHTFDPSAHAPGTYTLEAIISDAGDNVRLDQAGLLTDSHSWTVNVVAPYCCLGNTGDLNGDDAVDVSDLTTMVNALFVTFVQPSCLAAANTSGDPGCAVDVSDLTAIVNRLFVTFEPLAPCNPDCE